MSRLASDVVPAPPRQLGTTINRIVATAGLVLALAVGGLTFVFGYQYQLGAQLGRPTGRFPT